MGILAPIGSPCPWLDAGLSLVYPAVCALCGVGRATADMGYVCSDCATAPGHVRPVTAPFCRQCGLPFDGEITDAFACSNCRDREWSFEWARASLRATPFVLDLIHRYKYSGSRWFEPFLGRHLSREWVDGLADGSWEAIVPVPLHSARRREREFNQATRLARYLGRSLGLPVWEGAARRVESTRTQALLDRRERAKNVARAFAVPEPGLVAGRRLVVFDDVLTTGATTDALARALRRAGAERVVVWTLVRGV